jgi:hypothetical protein
MPATETRYKKFKEPLTPLNDSKGLMVQVGSPDVQGGVRPVCSQSVDLFQRRSRGSTIVRRRKFLLHEKSDQSIRK